MKRLSFHTLLLPNASLLLDLDHILTPCTSEYYTSEGCQVEGFNFSGYDPNHCLPFYLWCSPSYPYTCDELAGKTATGKTIDPQMCSNQTFWEKKSCNSERYYRCTGDTPGQCKYDVEGNDNEKYIDGSSEIKPSSEGGSCGEKVMCTSRDGKWAGRKICVEEKFKCDNYVQCEDAKDEDGCEEEYLMRGIFTWNDWYLCQSPYLKTRSEENKTAKFFPIRAIRCSRHHLQLYNCDHEI